MSPESPHDLPREEALKAARRRLQSLEAETHRMKAQLSRLEANFEDDVADELSANRQSPGGPTGGVNRPAAAPDDEPSPSGLVPEPIEPAASGEWPAIVEPPADQFGDALVAPSTKVSESPLAPARSLLASFGIHIAILLICLPLTYATLMRNKEPSPSTPSVLVEPELPQPDEIEVAAAEPDALDTQTALLDSAQGDLATHLLSDLPLEPSSAPSLSSRPAMDVPGLAIADLGPTTVPSPAGGGNGTTGENEGPGGDGSGGRGDGTGSAAFFGTRSQGDRFVFIVDDSSSMKDGRLEAALAELVRSVDALGRRQSFYVVFVSDKTYPMFYPDRAPDLVPATPENKMRLGQWLGRVRLASGKNRELINAMDLAASLRPHAVFLLWDGDLRYSEAVRDDVMQHLAGPQPWNFVVHTLGMGTLTPESELNLAMIAKAHRGTYRHVEVAQPEK